MRQACPQPAKADAGTCLGGHAREHGCDLHIAPLLPACSGNPALIEGSGYTSGTGHSLFLNFTDDREHVGCKLIGGRLGRGRAARLSLR
jgi:hypothetical protein